MYIHPVRSEELVLIVNAGSWKAEVSESSIPVL
jgi:hypothetical protein